MGKKIAIFPGSFDPFTKGHQDIVLRGTELFDEVIVAIGDNSSKLRMFDVTTMKDKITETFSGNEKVSVKIFKGLTGIFAKEQNANFILRGIRNTTDFEYENTIAIANKHINKDLETVFLITQPILAGISSTIVRDLYKYGADVSNFVPYNL